MADAASQPQEQQPQPVMKIMKRPAQPPSAWKAPPKLVSNVSVAIGCTTAESAVADTTGPKPRETAAGTPAAVSNDLLETATAQAVPTEGAAAAAAAAATALPPPPAQPQSTATGSSEATAHPISIAPEQPVVPKQPLVQGQHQPAMKIMRRPLLPTPPGRLMAPPLSGAGGPGAVATAPPFEGNVREEAVKLISQALMEPRHLRFLARFDLNLKTFLADDTLQRYLCESMGNYQRLLVHRIADTSSIQHPVEFMESGDKSIALYKTADGYRPEHVAWFSELVEDAATTLHQHQHQQPCADGSANPANLAGPSSGGDDGRAAAVTSPFAETTDAVEEPAKPFRIMQRKPDSAKLKAKQKAKAAAAAAARESGKPSLEERQKAYEKRRAELLGKRDDGGDEEGGREVQQAAHQGKGNGKGKGAASAVLDVDYSRDTRRFVRKQQQQPPPLQQQQQQQQPPYYMQAYDGRGRGDGQAYGGRGGAGRGVGMYGMGTFHQAPPFQPQHLHHQQQHPEQQHQHQHQHPHQHQHQHHRPHHHQRRQQPSPQPPQQPPQTTPSQQQQPAYMQQQAMYQQQALYQQQQMWMQQQQHMQQQQQQQQQPQHQAYYQPQWTNPSGVAGGTRSGSGSGSA